MAVAELRTPCGVVYITIQWGGDGGPGVGYLRADLGWRCKVNQPCCDHAAVGSHIELYSLNEWLSSRPIIARI